MSAGDPVERVVVVGAGMAAVRLSEGLAARGVDVTVLGDEDHPPYNRILLSAVLEGTHDPSLIDLHPRDWYAEHGIDLRLGTRVVEIDREATEVLLADDTRVAYDRLVLATGAIPSLPPIRGMVGTDGILHPAVHSFRGMTDCHRLDRAVRGLADTGSATNRAVIVGGGLLGLQVARALGVRGLGVEVVEGGAHLLGRQVGARAGRVLARDLRSLGAEVYTGARVTRLLDTAVGACLGLDNGATLDADLVVLTAGGRPSTALARRAGLVVRRGVVVDEHLTTSDPRVHAIGDCAEHAGVVTGFVPPAWHQAAVLAEHLAGGTATSYAGHRPVARLRATGLDVAVLGDPVEAVRADGAEVVEMTNPIVGSHRQLVVRHGRIVAATLVGDLTRVGLITGHYDRGTLLGPGEPGALLAAERPARPTVLADDAEVCTCAGVTAGAVRACSSLEQVRSATRATTGCGGCADDVRSLLASRPLQPTGGTPGGPS